VAKKKQELPASKEAEQIVLGSMLRNEADFWRLCDRLKPEHFSDEILGSIYRTMMALGADGVPINALTVSAKMNPDAADGTSIVSVIQVALLKADDTDPSIVIDYLDNLIDAYERRTLVKGLEVALKDAKNMDVPIGSTMLAVDHTLTILSGRDGGAALTLGAAADAVLRDVEKAWNSEQRPGLSSGLQSIDDLVGTFVEGDLVILMGDSGSGKTALAMQIARHMANAVAAPAMFFSLEMGEKQLAARELASEAAVPVRDVRRASLDAEQMERLVEANARLSASRLELRTGIKHLPLIRLAALRQRKMTGLSAIFIDHLGLVRVKGDPKIFEQVTIVSNACKDLAKEAGCPLFLLAQRNRQSRMRDNSQPSPTDVMGGSTIEQAADIMLAVHRRESYLRNNEPSLDSGQHDKWSEEMRQWEGKGEVYCLKLRDGPAGTKRIMRWNGPLTRYEEL
jgi:replicative DNA helicase